jgi:hypothetical protein
VVTAFDNYSKPLQGESDAGSTPYAQVVRQQAQGGYQSIPGATQQTSAATKTGTLAANRQGSYLSYLNQVINGTLPSDEGDKRAAYIPNSQGTANYSGSGYVDRNVAMAGSAIPSAYQYAGVANNSNPYGVNQLEWGGPASGKTGNPLDYLPYGTLTSAKANANSFLENALIPQNLAGEVANNLYGKWMGDWNGKFNQLAQDRAAQQDSWWNQSDWATKSVNPAWKEVIAPAVAEQPEVAYQPEVKAQAAVAAGYYTPSQQEYNDWVNQDYQNRLEEPWTFTNGATGEKQTYKGSELDAWLPYFEQHKQNMITAYGGSSWNLDPSSPSNLFRQSDLLYSSRGKPGGGFADYFDGAFYDLGYDPWGGKSGYLDLFSAFPDQWGNYQGGKAAVAYQPEVQARDYVPGSPEVAIEHPQTNKDGFTTVVDPITGKSIPNYYQGGPFNSNQDLRTDYGNADWYLK